MEVQRLALYQKQGPLMSLETVPSPAVAEATRLAAPAHPRPVDGLIDLAEVCRITSLSRTTIWRLGKADQFPCRRRLAPNRVAWKLSEVLSWCDNREAVTA